ncbi:MAG: DUF3558 domain-containing protein [Mycobacterium sp.]
MRWRVNPVAAVAVAAVVAVAGCSEAINGSVRRAQHSTPDANRSYGYVNDRCGLLPDGSVQQMMGADHIVRPYSGAVCQYVLSRGAGPDVGAAAPRVVVDVVFSWYESGSLDRERALAAQRGATITEKTVERHQGFLARRDTTGAACAADAAAGTGVLSWWVQFRNQRDGDPCQDAEKLLTATLRSEM